MNENGQGCRLTDGRAGQKKQPRRLMEAYFQGKKEFITFAA
jgi:hypothetical protein